MPPKLEPAGSLMDTVVMASELDSGPKPYVVGCQGKRCIALWQAQKAGKCLAPPARILQRACGQPDKPVPFVGCLEDMTLRILFSDSARGTVDQVSSQCRIHQAPYKV